MTFGRVPIRMSTRVRLTSSEIEDTFPIASPHDIPHVWTMILARQLFYAFDRHLRRLQLPDRPVETYEDEGKVVAVFTQCFIESQETLRPQIPHIYDRFQRTKKQRFSRKKREELLKIAEKLLSPAFVQHMLDAYFDVDRAA